MRILVTGIGVVSPLARGAGPTMDRLVAGDRAFGPRTLFELAGSRVDIAAEVKGLSAAEVAPPGEAEGWSRTDAMAVHATREALARAGVDVRRMPVDLIVGGTTAGMFETEDLLAELSKNPAALAPLKRMLSHPLSSTADHVRAAVGPFRGARSVCSACSSRANAMLLAASWIRAGRSTCVVAGAADGLCQAHVLRVRRAGGARSQSMPALRSPARRAQPRRRRSLLGARGRGGGAGSRRASHRRAPRMGPSERRRTTSPTPRPTGAPRRA